MTCTVLVTALLLSVRLFVPQANMGLPSDKNQAVKSPDCRATAQVLADGTMRFKDCSGSRTSPNLFAETGPKSTFQIDTTTRPSISGYTDPETNRKYQESLQAALDYQIYSYSQAKKTFDWQYWSSKIIFWVVLLVVIAGLVFSALQFYLGFALGRTPKGPAVTNLEASLKGIKISSSVLGVIILTISIAFFYLYLKYVYPISNVSG